MSQSKNFVVTEEHKNQRLDNVVVCLCQNLSRSQIKNLIDGGKIFLNGKIVKSGYKVNINDEIIIEFEEVKQSDILAEDIKLNIIYEDDDLAVINKSQGMVVHPSGGCYSGTLVNALMFSMKNLSGINGVARPGIVHRLDKDTSGLLVVAKNDTSHAKLAKQIAEKSCKRYYKALLYGKLKNHEGEIETYLNRGTDNRKKIFVVPEGKGRLALTKYKLIKEFGGYSLVEFELKTGRTHQIRVHAAHIGHPVVGDKTYAKVKDKFDLSGQLLHAYKLEFMHPTTGKWLSFEAPLPDYFEKVLNSLSK